MSELLIERGSWKEMTLIEMTGRGLGGERIYTLYSQYQYSREIVQHKNKIKQTTYCKAMNIRNSRALRH